MRALLSTLVGVLMFVGGGVLVDRIGPGWAAVMIFGGLALALGGVTRLDL